MNAPDAKLLRRLHAGLPPPPMPGALEQVVLHTAISVIATDDRRLITWVNPAFERLTGYTLAEALGRSPGELLQCAQTDRSSLQRLHQALDAGQPVRETLLNRSREGRLYWIDLDIHPFHHPGRAPGSRPDGFIAFQTDLALHGMVDDGLRAAIDSASAGLVVQDDSGHIVDCNPAAERLLGLSRSQMMGVTSIDRRWRAVDADGQPLPGDQHPAMRTLRSGEPERDVVMGIDLPDGERRWLAVNTNPLPGAPGARRVVASFTDVTATRELALTLETRWHQLRQMLDGTGTALWEWNVQTGEIRYDERWAEIVGYRLDELQPLSLATWQRLCHPDDLAHSDAQWARHFAGELACYDTESRLRHRDGHWRWVRGRGRVATTTADGAPQWVYGTNDDITERKQAELAAREAHARLQGLFDLSPAGILRQHPDTLAVLDCNAAMARISGHAPGALLTMTGHDLAAPGCLLISVRQQAQLAASGRCRSAETALRHRRGHRVAVSVAAMRLSDADGSAFLWTIVKDVSRHKALQQELIDAARTDRLTGLPNRAQMMDRLSAAVAWAAQAAGRQLALLFLDFDRFKLVNDAYGHGTGDALLVAIADRLRAALAAEGVPAGRPAALAARFGGDEFVVLMPEIADAGQAGALAQRLLASLALPYRLRQADIHSTASIGIALGDGRATDAEALLRNADTAMYEAKRRGHGQWVFFDDGMHAALARAVQIETALRLAIARGEMALRYQPIVDLASGAMTSVEALLRWTTPGLGAVSPDEFIPIAEDSGQIVAIGEWVLRSACTQWATWQAQDAARTPRGMSVNLSRVQMQLGPRLLQVVQHALDDAGMPAPVLQLEITEREVMKDPAGALELMRGLRGMGVKLAMDDFGSGTSSLGCLRDYPFDTIKIDKSFVSDLSRDHHVLAVAHATVNLIENLGMVSVAEGIEDPAEAAVLQSMGCRYGQGWLFAKALPADRVLGWVMPSLPAAS